jgi:hypothetical protein
MFYFLSQYFLECVHYAAFNFFIKPENGQLCMQLVKSVVNGTYKKKQGFIRLKSLWDLDRIHRLLEHNVMCVVINVFQ